MSGLEKFYSLNPQFYESLCFSSKASSSFLEQAQTNQKLNQADFEHRLRKAVSAWHTHLLFDEAFLENKNLKSYIRWAQESRIRPVLLVSMRGFSKHKTKLEKLADLFWTSQDAVRIQDTAAAQSAGGDRAGKNRKEQGAGGNDEAFGKNQDTVRDQEAAGDQAREEALDRREDLSLEFHFICEDNSFSIEELSAFKNKASLVYVITKKNRNGFSAGFQDFFKKRYLYFPYKSHFKDPFLTAHQAYRFLKKDLKLPPYPVDIYDKRIPKDMDLAPLYLPFFENPPLSRSVEGERFFSVVIPCYNSGKQLLNTLKCLAAQDFPKDQYEVIAVDDGSPQPIRQSLTAFSKENPSMNIKGIYFPRVIEKTKKSARFRAGLARNLGAKHSRGKYLAFLDSDILTPPDYLSRLKKEHETADLVLVKRYHLSDNFLKEGFKFDELFPEPASLFNKDQTSAKEELKLDSRFAQDQTQKTGGLKLDSLFAKDQKELKKIKAYIEEESYWGSFYKKGFDKVESPWKYICAYGLSLLRKDFNEVGGFGKSFLFYGFEDTDLGYRLLKKNKKAVLSSLVVFHQPSAESHGSMAWSYPLFRQKQLTKTAKIFFYRHLDPEIYRALRVYMRQERPLSYFL